MRVPTAYWLALALLAAGPVQAGPVAETLDYAPRFTGKLGAYGFGTDFQGIRGKTGAILRECGAKRRGVSLRVTEDGGFGFFQVFPDPNQKRQPVEVTTWLDLTKLGATNACLELDSPFVPIGMPPPAFAAFCAFRQPDESFLLFGATQAGNLPDTLTLPAGTPGATFVLTYDLGKLSVSAAACGAVPQPLVVDLALPFDTSAGLGFGVNLGVKGDRAGFAFEVSGDLFDAAKRSALKDLQAVIDLETSALADLGAGMNAQARMKLEDARKLIEEQGPQVPLSDPPEFEPDLVEKVGALPESDARADVLKRLGKAAKRDATARDKIDRGRPADLAEARKQADKALQDKVRAKAVLETGVVAEGNGKL